MTARGGIYGDLHGDGKPVAVATQPDSIPAEWIEACAREMWERRQQSWPERIKEAWDAEPQDFTHKLKRDFARAEAAWAITILRPLIEAETRERCAALVERDEFVQAGDVECNYCYAKLRAKELASALRAEGSPTLPREDEG